jgi:fructokinase
MTGPVVGIGELLWDVYPDGRAVAGGAPFNFAFHCHQLGHPAVIVSRVGDDDLGRGLRERVRELGLSDEYIQTDHDHPTGTVRVALDEHKVPTFTIAADVAWDHIGWDEQLEGLAGRAAATCFGSLAQRATGSRTTIGRWVGSCRAAGALAVCDVNVRKPFADPGVLAGCWHSCDWLKWSYDDATAIGRLSEAESWPAGVKKPVEVMTLGEWGVDVSTPEGEHFHEPAEPVKVVDTVGAGDAFTAAMVCLHLEGRPLRDCARFANHYAARACEHPGGTPRIDRRDVERAAFGT